METNINDLFSNCIYSSIAHAIYTLHNPFFAYEQSWDSINYCFNYGASRGTITFDRENQLIVGAMRKEDSNRIFLYPNELKAEDLFAKAPETIRSLAKNEALMYLYDTIGDFTGPVATTGFWGINNSITLIDDEKVFIQQGGEFLEILLKKHNDIKEYWEEQYELSPEDIGLIDKSYSIYLHGEREIELGKSLKNIQKQKGYDEMVKCFAEIGMTIKTKSGFRLLSI